MINNFGDEIVEAYTNGNSIGKIYSYGNKVWEKYQIPGYYTANYIQGQYPVYNQQTTMLTGEPPRIVLNIPYVQGGLVLEAQVKFVGMNQIGDGFTVFNSYYNYNSSTKTGYEINGCFLSHQSGGYYVQSDYTRGNLGTSTSLGFHTITQTIPDDNYDNKLYVDGVEISASDDYTKTHYTFTDSENIRIVLSSNDAVYTGSRHHLVRFRIKDSNNNVLYDYIPVVRISDDEPGLYDVINNTFHPKAEAFYTVETLLDFSYTM